MECDVRQRWNDDRQTKGIEWLHGCKIRFMFPVSRIRNKCVFMEIESEKTAMRLWNACHLVDEMKYTRNIHFIHNWFTCFTIVPSSRQVQRWIDNRWKNPFAIALCHYCRRPLVPAVIWPKKCMKTKVKIMWRWLCSHSFFFLSDGTSGLGRTAHLIVLL